MTHLPSRVVAVTILVLGSLVASVLGREDDSSQSINFSRDVRPILADNCFQCHGPDDQQREADLRLDTQQGVRTVVSLDEADESELLRRISSLDEEEVMPPRSTKKRLTAQQIRTIKRWIHGGATWETHWAFTRPDRPKLPAVSLSSWPRNALDRFVLAKLEARGIVPSPEASRPNLIRRLYLDLLGILPTREQVDAFVGDARPNAYEQLVDQALANPHYGERWGRHWLDQARYADSDGYALDGARVMWPYRDWVIGALNSDLPFDQFSIEQLAGDLLTDPTTEQLVATGFHRNTLINHEGGSDPEQFRNETVVDRTNTTGAVWLGLTIGCAQCHAHKFDPISHSEYYQLFAFFNSSQDKNSHDPRIVAALQHQQPQLQTLRNEVQVSRRRLEDHKKQKAGEDELQQAMQILKKSEQHLREFEDRYGKTMIMQELAEPRETFVLVRGDFLRPGQRVEAGVPKVLGDLAPSRERNRLDLAHWLVAPENPLTARVTVNRIWMRYFGRGIVETENDFGTQGTLPSHPELLDWLATEIIRQQWSIKAIHRLIVTSATYRQMSDPRGDLAEVDPANRLLARQSRLRVSAEIVRDLALGAGGVLVDRIGGPSVYPPQPEGVYAFTQRKKNWTASQGENRFRRGMYTFFFRSAGHPFLTTFDTPNFQTTCTRRLRSNTPLQSLTLANDEAMMDAARHLAQRIMAAPERSVSERIVVAFRTCLCRSPSDYELTRLLSFFKSQCESFQHQPEAARELGQTQTDESQTAAWTAVSRVLFNLDEFVTRN